jgi:hypothetical protein
VGVLGTCARALAGVLHSAAETLEAWAAPSVHTPFHQAMAVLAERYPGAPEHWLAYIAERAPHLAQPDEAAPPGQPSTPEPRPMADEIWPRRAPLALSAATARRRPSITVARMASEGPHPTLALSASSARAPRRPPLRFFAGGSERRPGLRLLPVAARAAPRLDLAARRLQPAPAPLDLAAPRPTAPSVPTWTDPPAERWPSLPSLVEEALEDPPATPDAVRFRAEQDEGAWSG